MLQSRDKNEQELAGGTGRWLVSSIVGVRHPGRGVSPSKAQRCGNEKNCSLYPQLKVASHRYTQ